MKLSDKITIVVPCKNEENYIHHLLESLHDQDIDDTRIIIADCSTDNTRQVIQDNKGLLNVEIIEGGPVSIAKNNGAAMVTTPISYSLMQMFAFLRTQLYKMLLV
jgi:glycosyltransferase involved in cell wall biosynthesis